MADLLLALNTGSSSLKFALFEAGDPPRVRMRGMVEGFGHLPRITIRSPEGDVIEDQVRPDARGREPVAFAGEILALAEGQAGTDPIAAFSHRIAHGGPDFFAPVELTGEVLQRLESLTPLAPLHEPYNLAMARAVAALRPGTLNVGCFDTAFFHDLPAVARRVPLPREWEARGVRRYGFHGLSYSFLRRRLAELRPLGAPRRVVFAHLGSGASLCACLDGQPIDTTMGFSPLDGVVMSTRCGALDPGVVLYLLQQDGVDVSDVQTMLYRQSGLLAVSGLSGDMRTLLASDLPAAREAVDMFVHSVARQVGGLAARLGGLDALVFSAGIGEHAPEIRRRVCDQLAWMGVDLEPAANAAGALKISKPASGASVWVIPTDEERSLAEGASELLGRRSSRREADAA